MTTNRWRDAREDIVLARRLRHGDPEALERIYEKYRLDLLRIAACLVFNSSAAEDVLHDVFVALASGAPRLRAGRYLKRYLAVSVVNRARDALRGGTIRDRLCPAPLYDVAEPASSSPSPFDVVQGEETASAIREALGQLPLDQREAITLHLNGGLTFREIAREQQQPINTVMSRYRYGLARLRSHLKGESYHEIER